MSCCGGSRNGAYAGNFNGGFGGLGNCANGQGNSLVNGLGSRQPGAYSGRQGNGVAGLPNFLQTMCTSNIVLNVGDGIINGQTETAFSDLVATPMVCALTECEDGMDNPFSPNCMCLTRYTTYWIVLTNTANGAGRVSYRFPKAGDYILEVVALMSTPQVTLKPLAVWCGYRIAFSRNVGAIMCAYNKFTVNSVDLITFDYHYIIAYWNFALSAGKFPAYRFCVGDVPSLTAPQIALQPYILSVPIPYYFGNVTSRAFPLVGAGFSDVQSTIQTSLTWADVLIVYKTPISVEAQLLLIAQFGAHVLPPGAIASLNAGNTCFTSAAFGPVDPLVANQLAALGENTEASNCELGLQVANGCVTYCVRSLISGLCLPVNMADANNFDCNSESVGVSQLLNTSQLPLGVGVLARTARSRAVFIPQQLWRQYLNQPNDCRNIFLDSSNLLQAPIIVMVALYGIVTNAMRTALQSCVLDYAIQTVQMATTNSVTMGVPSCNRIASNNGSNTETQLNFLYAVTAILYMAENETSKLFGIYGNYSANIFSYAGPDPITFMQLNYESSTRWSGAPEVLSRLEALDKAPRYPRSMHDAQLLGNAFTGEFQATPYYLTTMDDINGLNLLSYGVAPFDGCTAGGVVDFGTITVTFRAKIRSANPNCIFVHSNGGGEAAGAQGLLCSYDDSAFPGFGIINDLFAPDASTCLPSDFTVRIYAISYQILRFQNGLMGYAILG